MAIGSLGDVVFEVSSDAVKTFDDMSVQLSAKYAQHDIHGRKGLLEFTGLAPSTLSLKIHLSAALGIVPKEELTALRDMLKAGKAVPFILDGEPQGDGLWVIESLNENHKVINNAGALVLAEASLSLKEYVEGGDTVGS
jgi:phage protein U